MVSVTATHQEGLVASRITPQTLVQGAWILMHLNLKVLYSISQMASYSVKCFWHYILHNLFPWLVKVNLIELSESFCARFHV